MFNWFKKEKPFGGLGGFGGGTSGLAFAGGVGTQPTGGNVNSGEILTRKRLFLSYIYHY